MVGFADGMRLQQPLLDGGVVITYSRQIVWRRLWFWALHQTKLTSEFNAQSILSSFANFLDFLGSPSLISRIVPRGPGNNKSDPLVTCVAPAAYVAVSAINLALTVVSQRGLQGDMDNRTQTKYDRISGRFGSLCFAISSLLFSREQQSVAESEGDATHLPLSVLTPVLLLSTACVLKVIESLAAVNDAAELLETAPPPQPRSTSGGELVSSLLFYAQSFRNVLLNAVVIFALVLSVAAKRLRF